MSNGTTSNGPAWPTVASFKDADEIVADLHTALHPDDVAFFKLHADPAARAIDAVWAFMSLGRWIRNTYNLWHPSNPHTVLKHVPVIVNGADESEFHPDNFSAMIIERFLNELKNQPSAEDLMIKELKDLGLTS